MRLVKISKNFSFERPGSIGFNIDTVMVLLLTLGPALGHTKPELIATGWQTIFNAVEDYEEIRRKA